MVEITVNDATGLSDRSFLSVRVGDIRRQMQFKPGGRFRFDGEVPPRHFVVDLFEKVGSTQVSMADLGSIGGGTCREGAVKVPRNDGTVAALTLRVDLAMESTSPKSKKPADAKKSLRDHMAIKAKSYLDEHAVQNVLQGMVHNLLEKQPSDPIAYMTSFLQKTPPPAVGKTLPAEKEPTKVPPAMTWSAKPGLGDADMPGFAADGTQPLPNLDRHFSLAAKLLREDPFLYERLRVLCTSGGSNLARCIKAGMDNVGHPMIRTLGLVACDDECYSLFAELFVPVLRHWHGDDDYAQEGTQHPTRLEPWMLPDARIDPAGKHVVSVEVRATRNLKGILMPTACSFVQRRKVESLLVEALMELKDEDLQGAYFPLRGSSSHLPKPQGMSVADEKQLQAKRCLFEEPDASVILCSGYGRHWPDARGVFQCRTSGLFANINEMDHFKLISRRNDGDLREAFERLVRAMSSVEETLRQNDYQFARTDRFGFVSTCPSQVGTAMCAVVVMRIPMVSDHDQFPDLAKALNLLARVHVDKQDGTIHEGVWDITAPGCLGTSEVDQISALIEGCETILDMERRFENGETFDLVEWTNSHQNDIPADKFEEDETMLREGGTPPGLGCSEYPGFPAWKCPETLPDLSEHHSMLATVLKNDPSIFTRLRTLATLSGVTLAKCIKTGIDNKGHPMIRTVGLFAGDDECYEVFRELFDPVIAQKHPNCDVTAMRHVTLLDDTRVGAMPIDSTGERVFAVNLRVSRCLHGLRMPAACTLQGRREAERVLAKALVSLTGDIQGDYFPLTGSESYAPKPGGLSIEEADMLRKEGFLFDETDSAIALSAGIGREWPDGRGVFVSTNRKLSAWINEEEHLRLTFAEKGQDVKGAFSRLCRALDGLQDSLRHSGYTFAKSDRLGYVCSSPANLGTCFTATVSLKIPVLSKETHFRQLCAVFGVHARSGIGGVKGSIDISNIRRLGSSEIQQLNSVVMASRLFVKLEAQLELGEAVDFSEQLKKAESRLAARNDETTDNSANVPGLGDEPYPGFPVDVCPEKLPDLSSHYSILADVFREHPGIYQKMRVAQTPTGVTLARCIKPGMDNCGHPMAKIVGIVAGDASCYEVFREIFEPVVSRIHCRNLPTGVASKGLAHCTDLDYSKVRDVILDPERVRSVRIRAQRNIAGLRMPSACTRDERKTVELLVTRALEGLTGEFAGEYFPLSGSTSYPSRSNGMSLEERQRLEQRDLLFHEPDSVLVLASGTGRNWPEARGVFVAGNMGFSAWVNEEDHLRLHACEDGTNLKEVFRRFCVAEDALRCALLHAGHGFAKNQRLGFLTVCPSNAGSALRAEITVSLPRLGAQPGFKALCNRMALQARLSRADNDSRDSTWDISNMERLGPSEAEQVNTVLLGVDKLLNLEMRLERGESVDLKV
eukprot:TRINITY_DN68721_c0_g1_i1.p1 TRINITY_DN68721_c0_g1~~TRINITY_DN68721_c0_g1_i1.p1  ORF type:complete len:1415 (-),score=218.75 TRINITY_DN68721_c0_g1_i1:288-4532(-)